MSSRPCVGPKRNAVVNGGRDNSISFRPSPCRRHFGCGWRFFPPVGLTPSSFEFTLPSPRFVPSSLKSLTRKHVVEKCGRTSSRLSVARENAFEYGGLDNSICSRPSFCWRRFVCPLGLTHSPFGSTFPSSRWRPSSLKVPTLKKALKEIWARV